CKDGRKLAQSLKARGIQGVRFVPLDVRPRSNKFEWEVCHGVNILLLDREALDSPELGAELAAALYKLFPKDFELDKTLALVGSRQVLEGIRAGGDPRTLALHWEVQLEKFRKLRGRSLLYGDSN